MKIMITYQFPLFFGGKPAHIKQSFVGIKVKKAAVYLGVGYNNILSLNYSIKCINKKISYTFLRLYPVLKKVRFKVRVFLWKIIVWPVFMMLFSLAGPSRSMTADKNIELILKRAQISLKKFTLSPRNAGCEWFVRILNTQKEEIHLGLNKIEKDTEKHVREKIPDGEFLQILFCVEKKLGNERAPSRDRLDIEDGKQLLLQYS